VEAVSSRLLHENENTFLKKIDEISIIDPTNSVDNCTFNSQSPSFDSSGQHRPGNLQDQSQHNQEGLTNHSASIQPRIENGLANGWSIDRYASVQPRNENGLANDLSAGYSASVQHRYENGLANGWSIDCNTLVQPRFENGLANGWYAGYSASVQPRFENGLANGWSIDHYASVQPQFENGLANGWSTNRSALVQLRIENGLANDLSAGYYASVQPRNENGLANDWSIDRSASVQSRNENGLAHNLSDDPHSPVNPPPIPVSDPVQPQPRNEPIINKTTIKGSDNSSAVNNRYNCNWSINDCSFLMHEANLPNMDKNRELVRKPIESHVPFASSVLDKKSIKNKKVVLTEGKQVADLVSPQQRASKNDPVE